MLSDPEPVLAWTLRRLARSTELAQSAILCWDDQAESVQQFAGNVTICSKGPRVRIAGLDAITASRKFSDGWRGGLLGTCWFDLGFHAAWMNELCNDLSAEAITLIDPDSALVDASLIDRMIGHARSHSTEYCFSPAAPGLSGVLIRASLLEQLARAGAYLGRALNYWPDLPGRDPIAAEQCAPVPTSVARTTQCFTLDSNRQIHLFEQATASLNGQLMETDAEQLIAKFASIPTSGSLPRDITLEIPSIFFI